MDIGSGLYMYDVVVKRSRYLIFWWVFVTFGQLLQFVKHNVENWALHDIHW